MDPIAFVERVLSSVQHSTRVLTEEHGAEGVVTAGKALVAARQFLRQPFTSGGPIEELRRETAELHHEATVVWAARSREDIVREHVRALADSNPGAVSNQLAVVGVPVLPTDALLMQFDASFGLLDRRPADIWQPHYQALLVTDGVAQAIIDRNGMFGPGRATSVEIALVPSATVAHTAAVLWEPLSTGTYASLADAVEAAKAITGERSVASPHIRQWVDRTLGPSRGMRWTG